MQLVSEGRLARLPSPEEVHTGGGVGRAVSNVLAVAIPIAVILAIWELAVRLGNVPPALLPPLSEVITAIYRLWARGLLWADIASTTWRLLQSVAAGIVVGTLLGMLMGYFRLWERALVAPMNFLLAIPGTALFPLSMIWFGFSELAITAVLIFEVALTVMLNTWMGVKTVDIHIIRAGRTFGASGPSLFRRVLLPAALPSIIAGYRLAFSRCWRILIVAEMLVSVSAGLGYRIYWAREYLQSDIVYGGLLVVGIVGLLIERVFLRTLEVATVQRWGVMRELK
jgi:ABC-type nitrate/sulfonate/bicarbonate transport system permease component